MSKTLIIGLALAVVLVGGAFFSAQAECGFGCLPHITLPSCWSCASVADRQPARDYDRPGATCQGAFRYGPVTPEPMGSPGF